MTIPVQIRNEESVRYIRELAALTGKPITEAVTEAVKAQLVRARRGSDADARRRDVRRLVEELHKLPRVGPPLTDDDLYDDDGFPK